MPDRCGIYLISNERFSSEDIFTALMSFSMVVVDGNVKEVKEYRGRLYGSLRGVGSDLIKFMALVMKYWSNVSISVVIW